MSADNKNPEDTLKSLISRVNEASAKVSENLSRLLIEKYKLPKDITRENLMRYLENEASRVWTERLGLEKDNGWEETSKIMMKHGKNAKWQ